MVSVQGGTRVCFILVLAWGFFCSCACSLGFLMAKDSFII